MDETSLAFELPHMRAAATSSHDPLDRISVRDYTRDVEIGAFQAERGVTQRIRFNVVLEVSRNAAAATDDVDQVLSYDTITEAIDAQLQTERINLLETLAERVAERVLANPKAVRVFVRIEKLDRIPGTLGVEIARSRIAHENVVRPLKVRAELPDQQVHPLVVFLPNAVLHSHRLGGWLDAIAGHELPAIICVEAASGAMPATAAALANRRIALLSIEQNAWVLAGRDKRCVVVDSRTELDWAIKHGQLSVWAPSKIVLDAVKGPKGVDLAPLDLARWFASEFSAQSLVVLEGYQGAESDDSQRIVGSPDGL
ncbi:MAG: dihydroneopterin aldolase [Rhodobacteraceae bacterium]|nr:dihydroneopterin aldolase [Paracoccaceae bacterium]